MLSSRESAPLCASGHLLIRRYHSLVAFNQLVFDPSQRIPEKKSFDGFDQLGCAFGLLLQLVFDQLAFEERSVSSSDPMYFRSTVPFPPALQANSGTLLLPSRTATHAGNKLTLVAPGQRWEKCVYRRRTKQVNGKYR